MYYGKCNFGKENTHQRNSQVKFNKHLTKNQTEDYQLKF